MFEFGASHNGLASRERAMSDVRDGVIRSDPTSITAQFEFKKLR